MRQFFKYVLASITAYILLCIVFIFIIIGMIAAFSPDEKVKVEPNSVLKLTFNYAISDQDVEQPFNLFGDMSPDLGKPVGLNEITASILHAKDDPNIKGIFMDLNFIGAGYAKIEEIRDAVVEFKKSGKFVFAYGEYFYESTYYLASVADKIYLNPVGELLYNGITANVTFFKNALEKLGIEVQVIRHGKFKGAVEPFILESLSPENRKQINEYLQSIVSNLNSSIAKSRKLSVDQVAEIGNKWLVRNTEDALKYGLVDKLSYKDEVIQDILSELGLKGKSSKDLKLMTLNKYKKSFDSRKGKGPDRIAIIYASGEIVNGKGNSEQIGSDKYTALIRKLREDDKVKAVVLRINSPGGSALASDIIWRELDLLKKKKPLIVSMAEVAASGGYYMAAPADTIVAHPYTLTGSIGVFGLMPNMQKLLNDKLGINYDYVKTGEFSDFGRLDRPLSNDERELIQNMVERIYDKFLTRVSEGRNISKDQVDTIGQGRVWTGEQGIKIGLVDVMGGMNKAIEIAKWKSGLKDYRLVEYPAPKSQLEEILSSIKGDDEVKALLEAELGEFYTLHKTLRSLSKTTGIQARVPFILALD
ncbi:MAG: signal peptide peptidase SppA [Flavobacteriales bacterium]|nr:signal peptide peptidase SppA [Flavobacteriales bacterium]